MFQTSKNKRRKELVFYNKWLIQDQIPHQMVGDLYLYYMKPFEKFLENNSSLRELLDIYLELRRHLQEEGFSEEELERVTSPTLKMMLLHERFNDKKNTLFKQIRDYGFEIQKGDLIKYIQPLLNNIDELTPLKENGDNKRRNKRD